MFFLAHTLLTQCIAIDSINPPNFPTYPTPVLPVLPLSHCSIIALCFGTMAPDGANGCESTCLKMRQSRSSSVTYDCSSRLRAVVKVITFLYTGCPHQSRDERNF